MHLTRDPDHISLEAVATIAAQAAARVLETSFDRLDIQRKPDLSVVTNVDLEVERLITQGLRELAADIPVIGEETVSGLRTPSGGTYWLVDPIDGTEEFARGGDDYAIHIALLHHQKPILGVVSLPAHNALYVAQRGHGAWRRSPGQRDTRISCAPPGTRGLRVVASRRCTRLEAFRDWTAQKQIQSLDLAGSSLKFMRVADGEADIYPRFTPSMEWDTAAPQIIVEEAGGTVEAITGGTLTYGKEGWLNPGFMCFSLKQRPDS